MESQGIIRLWHDYERRLESSMRLNTLLLRRANMGKVESLMSRLTRGDIFEAAVNFIALVLIGSFAADNFRQLRFLVPAIVLGAYAATVFAGNIRGMIEIAHIDYDDGVVAIQKRLARLRIARMVRVRWILELAALMWTPLLIVVLRSLQVDAYAALGAAYLAANVIFGIAVIALAIWIAKRHAGVFGGSTGMRAAADQLAGRSLRSALDQLDTICRFEQEDYAPSGFKLP